MSLPYSRDYYRENMNYWYNKKNSRYETKEEYKTKKNIVKDKKEKLEQLQADCEAIVTVLNQISSSLSSAGGYLENVRVSGPPYDEGVLSNNATTLNTMSENFSQLANKCKINAIVQNSNFNYYNDKQAEYANLYVNAKNNYNYYYNRYWYYDSY